MDVIIAYYIRLLGELGEIIISANKALSTGPSDGSHAENTSATPEHEDRASSKLWFRVSHEVAVCWQAPFLTSF